MAFNRQCNAAGELTPGRSGILNATDSRFGNQAPGRSGIFNATDSRFGNAQAPGHMLLVYQNTGQALAGAGSSSMLDPPTRAKRLAGAGSSSTLDFVRAKRLAGVLTTLVELGFGFLHDASTNLGGARVACASSVKLCGLRVPLYTLLSPRRR